MLKSMICEKPDFQQCKRRILYEIVLQQLNILLAIKHLNVSLMMSMFLLKMHVETCIRDINSLLITENIA